MQTQMRNDLPDQESVICRLCGEEYPAPKTNHGICGWCLQKTPDVGNFLAHLPEQYRNAKVSDFDPSVVNCIDEFYDQNRVFKTQYRELSLEEVQQYYKNRGAAGYPAFAGDVVQVIPEHRKNVDRSPFLIVSGPVGSGKTRLLYAVCIQAFKDGYSAGYYYFQTFYARLAGSKYSVEAKEAFMESLMAHDVLFFDDLGVEASDVNAQAEIDRIINDIWEQKKMTMITTNLSVGEIERRYGKRVASRLLSGYLPVPLTGEDKRRVTEKKIGGISSEFPF